MFTERNIVQNVEGAGNTVEQFDKENNIIDLKEHHQREQLE